MAGQIKKTDTNIDRLSKLLPADVTGAFLSAKAGIIAFFNDPTVSASPIVWTFLIILLLCPFYFRYVSGVGSKLQNMFLMASFVVFAISIASNQFIIFAHSWEETIGYSLKTPINLIAIVLPILWVSIITQIALGMMGDTMEQEG